MNHLEKLIFTALLTPMKGNPNSQICIWGAPVLLWGGPGIGKSDHVENVAASMSMACETVYAQTIDPTDMTGILMLGPEGTFEQKTMIPQVRRLLQEDRGILFLDEINGGTKAVQRALMGVVLTRKVGDDTLPMHVRIVAAANPADVGADVEELPPPLANRMCHIDVTPPNSVAWGAWLTGALDDNIPDLQASEEIVGKGWGEQYAKACGLFARFIEVRPALLYSIPAEGAESRQKGWPSPRSWAMATRLWATSHILHGAEASSLALTLLMGAVGEGAATEFATWVKDMDIPSPTELLERGMKIDRKGRADRLVAAYSGLRTYLKGLRTEDKPAVAVNAWRRLKDLVDGELGDMAVPLASTLLQNGYGAKTCRAPGLSEAQTPLVKFIMENKLHGLL